MTAFRSYWRVPYLRRAALFALVTCLGAGFVATQLFAPAQDTHDTRLAQMQSISAARAELDARLALKDQVRYLSADIAVLDAKLAQGGERSGVVEKFAELAADTGVRIIHGTNRFGTETEGISPVFHELSVEGDYLSTRAFLAAAGELTTLTLLNAAEMTANPDGTVIRTQLEFVTYGGAGQ